MKYDVKSGKYVVQKFVKDHSCPMTDKEHVLFLRSHRNIADRDVAQAKSLHGIGVRITQIMKLFMLQSGG